MLGALDMRTVVALYIFALCLGAGLIGGCSTLPSLENRRSSTALFDTRDTKLGNAISPMVDAHPGLSGIYPLPDARDASLVLADGAPQDVLAGGAYVSIREHTHTHGHLQADRR